MSEPLPLFPLGTVLFPGLVLPLHIFEDRYRALMADLAALPEDVPRRFGVVCPRPGATELYEVGCTAEVTEVSPHPDGRFDIVTVGGSRFRVGDLDTGRPYLRAEVSFLDEAPDEDLSGVTTAVLARFTTYLAIVAEAHGMSTGLGPGSAALPDEPVTLSYLVAATMVLELADKQALLAAGSAAERLAAELELLRREISALRVLPSQPAPDLIRAAPALN